MISAIRWLVLDGGIDRSMYYQIHLLLCGVMFVYFIDKKFVTGEGRGSVSPAYLGVRMLVLDSLEILEDSVRFTCDRPFVMNLHVKFILLICFLRLFIGHLVYVGERRS